MVTAPVKAAAGGKPSFGDMNPTLADRLRPAALGSADILRRRSVPPPLTRLSSRNRQLGNPDPVRYADAGWNEGRGRRIAPSFAYCSPSDGADFAHKTRRLLIGSMLGLVYAGTLASGITLLAVSLAAAPFSSWWVANLLTNFRPQFVLLGLVVLALGLAIRTSHVAIIGAAIVVINAAVVAAGVWPASPAGGSATAGPVLRVMTLNLLFSNRDADAVFRYVAVVRPDVLLLQEVNAFWTDALEGLRDTFPYRLELPRLVHPAKAEHGVVLLSRHPILEHDRLLRGPRLAQFAAARVAVEGCCTLWVGSVHLVKPMSSVRLALQQDQFEQLATWVNARDGPLVLGGDFNATSWSPQVQCFVAATGLQLDQQAKPWLAFAGTYPASLPLLGLKLDHILVRDVVMPRVWIASSFGSDHRAVIADVLLSPVGGRRRG